MVGGDPRFGGGASPPPIRTRGKARYVAFWGLFWAAAGAAYGYHRLSERFAPDPIYWEDVDIGMIDMLSITVVGVGLGLVLLSPLIAIVIRSQ